MIYHVELDKWYTDSEYKMYVAISMKIWQFYLRTLSTDTIQ